MNSNNIPISHKTIWRVAISFLVIAGAILGYYIKKIQTSPPVPQSLSDILYFYDIKTAKQKNALELLMKKANILKTTESLDEAYPKRPNKNELFDDLLKFLQFTQQHFTIRKGNQERWEVNSSDWMKRDQAEILAAIQELGVTKAVTPINSRPDVICVLGARTSTMENRLAYTAELYNKKKLQAKHLVLLVGERNVTVGIDGNEQELSMIAKKYKTKIGRLTETHMMNELYQNSSLFGKMPTDIIDTPAGNLPRPTTETTLKEFCLWLKKHPDVKSVTFVSNQPHIQYQEAVIAEVLRHQTQHIQFEVIGSEVNPNAEIYTLIAAIGSQIWAKTPDVLAKTKLLTTDNQLLKEFLELYAKQPLIYYNVESILKVNQ